jgi:hypothetical protein
MRNRRAWMILLRHQVVEYSVASINLRYRTGLALSNAADLLAAIAPYASRVIVFHGLRHTDWIGSDVVLCSASSVALGSFEHTTAVWPLEAIRLLSECPGVEKEMTQKSEMPCTGSRP